MKNVLKYTVTMFAVIAFNVCLAQQKPGTTNPAKSNAVAPASEKKADTTIAPPSKEKTGMSNKIAVSDQALPGEKKPKSKDKVVATPKNDDQKKGISPK